MLALLALRPMLLALRAASDLGLPLRPLRPWRRGEHGWSVGGSQMMGIPRPAGRLIGVILALPNRGQGSALPVVDPMPWCCAWVCRSCSQEFEEHDPGGLKGGAGVQRLRWLERRCLGLPLCCRVRAAARA